MKSCPTKDGEKVECLPNKKYQTCDELTTLTYATNLSVDRFCTPTESALKQKLRIIFNVLNYDQMMETMVDNKMIFLYALIIAFVLSNIISFFLQKCTGVIVVACIIGFYVGSGWLGYTCFQKYRYYKGLADEADSSTHEGNVVDKTFKVYMITMWVIVGIVVMASIILIFLASKIVLAVKILMARYQINL